MGPKAPPYKIRNDVPELLDDLMNVFLPSSLSKEQRQSEMDLIRNFVSELNRVSDSFPFLGDVKVSVAFSGTLVIDISSTSTHLVLSCSFGSIILIGTFQTVM